MYGETNFAIGERLVGRLCMRRPRLWDLLHRISKELLCRVWTGAYQRFCLSSIHYNGNATEELMELENRWDCDIHRSNEALSCSVENRLQKRTSIDECHWTPSGAEEGLKVVALASGFLGTRWNRKGFPLYLPDLFRAYFLEVEIRRAHKHS